MVLTSNRLLPGKKELIRVALIVMILFPFLAIFRGPVFFKLSAARHMRELFFLWLTILINTWLLKKFHIFLGQPGRRPKQVRWKIIAEILFILVITPLITLSIFMTMYPAYTYAASDKRTPIFFCFLLLMIQLVFLYYYHFSDYLRRFRMSVSIQEKLRFEKITAQYRALQNHISPHFIFNSLGGLDHLVKNNPEQASRTIYNLSDCLQHIVVMLDKTMIPLSEEITFLRKYEELLAIRFPGSIEIDIFVDPPDAEKYIPPCLLQMLVENAVKHNTFNKEHKLLIIISSLGSNRLSVSNNCSKKMESGSAIQTGTGLENIVQRFALLTPEEVRIQQTETLFTINLPLLTIKQP